MNRPGEACDGRGRRLARPTLGDEDPPPRQTSGRPARGTEALLIPLARAQDGVARLEAAIATAPDAVAAGLRARPGSPMLAARIGDFCLAGQ